MLVRIGGWLLLEGFVGVSKRGNPVASDVYAHFG